MPVSLMIVVSLLESQLYAEGVGETCAWPCSLFQLALFFCSCVQYIDTLV